MTPKSPPSILPFDEPPARGENSPIGTALHAMRLPAITLVLAVLLPLAACSRHPLTTEAYIWQQKTSPDLTAAILRAAPDLGGFSLHAADLVFPANQPPGFTTFPQDWDALKKSRRPVELVIRIPSAAGGLDASRAPVVAELINSLLASADAADVPCNGIQIDYDCPTSRLSSYIGFLGTLHAAIPNTPIAFTALPTWMSDRYFPALCRVTRDYILQVHSVRLPNAKESAINLCDPAEALAAVASAAQIGVPFRLALPTYRSTLFLDPQGRITAVASEDGQADIKAARTVTGYSDPAQMANLVAELKKSHPPLLRGLIWYRLPVESDRLNWSWPTFLSVINGRVPARQVDAALAPGPEGQTLLQITNSGETNEPLPSALRVTWQSGRLTAADGLLRYGVQHPADGLRFALAEPPGAAASIRPGQTLTIGWLRLDGAAGLTAAIEGKN